MLAENALLLVCCKRPLAVNADARPGSYAGPVASAEKLACLVEVFNDKVQVNWHCPWQGLPVAFADLDKQAHTPEMLGRGCYFGQHPRIRQRAIGHGSSLDGWLFQLWRAGEPMRPHPACDIREGRYQRDARG